MARRRRRSDACTHPGCRTRSSFQPGSSGRDSRLPGRGWLSGTGNVDRVLVAAFELDPDSVARVVADADAAPELALEQEGAVLPRTRAKPADLDLLGALCERGAGQQTEQQNAREETRHRLHRTSSRSRSKGLPLRGSEDKMLACCTQAF